MTNYIATLCNGAKITVDGLIRIPCLVINAVSLLSIVELARRYLLAPAVKTVVDLDDEAKAGTLANCLKRYTPDLLLRARDIDDVSLFTSTIGCTLINSMGSMATDYLFGPPHPFYNQALQWLGPLNIHVSYSHPIVKLIQSRL
jgi:hypothetical protein